jgi:hypothetical protein
MKKIVYLLLVTIVFLSGCVDDSEPPTWNTDGDKKWEEVATGELLHFETVRGNGCSCEKQDDWCSEDYIFNVNDTRIIAGQLKRFEPIILGSTGTLYKYNNDKEDVYSWFLWANSKKLIKPKTEQKQTKPFIEKHTEIAPVIEYKEWNRSYSSKPTPYKTVLLRLEDKIITTGYVDKNNNWKLEFYKNRVNGGMSLQNVVEWKEIIID